MFLVQSSHETQFFRKLDKINDIGILNFLTTKGDS